MLNKSKLAEIVLTEEERKHIDITLPQEYVDKQVEMGAPDVRAWTVWSYIDSAVFGQPLNLAELYVERNAPAIAVLRQTETAKILIRKLHKTEHTYHEDAGHSWLQVNREALTILGIRTQITGASYQNNGRVYLEEDLDAITYLKRLFPMGLQTETYKQWEMVYLRSVNDGDSSRIRDFDHYEHGQ